MNHPIILAFLISFGLSAVLTPVLIPFLHKLKFGQTIREEGPKSHEKKSGTPTMGGISFLIAVLVTGLIFLKSNPKILPILFTTVGFGIVGFLDDFIKVVMKRSEGLKPWQKLSCQLVITAILCYYLIHNQISMGILIPFTNGYEWQIGILAIPLFFLAVLGTDNGVNLTDGLDGLCSSVTIVVALFLVAASLKRGADVEPICAAVAGGLLGFLIFNAYPAKVFMGDTGSLALGGFVVSTAYMLQMPIFILLFGFIYFAETLSVMLQVTYFKATHGKRIFRMTPIHHHYELGGWSETRIVTVFSTITVILCLIAYMAL